MHFEDTQKAQAVFSNTYKVIKKAQYLLTTSVNSCILKVSGHKAIN